MAGRGDRRRGRCARYWRALHRPDGAADPGRPRNLDVDLSSRTVRWIPGAGRSCWHLPPLSRSARRSSASTTSRGRDVPIGGLPTRRPVLFERLIWGGRPLVEIGGRLSDGGRPRSASFRDEGHSCGEVCSHRCRDHRSGSGQRSDYRDGGLRHHPPMANASSAGCGQLSPP
jgi:hypothetical protein